MMKKSRSKITFLLIAVLVVACIAAGVVLARKHHDDKETGATAKTRQPAVAQSPTVLLKSFQNYIGKEVSLKGLIVPSDASTYYIIGQETKSPGGIKLDFSKTSIDPKKYADIPTQTATAPTVPTTSQAAKTPPATVTASKSSPSAKTPAIPKPKGAVTVTGTLTQDKSTSQPILVVKSIH